jgi:hypothetical protein
VASNLEQIEALVPDFQYVEDDRIVTTVGFAAAFYFWGGHTAARREALVSCIEAFGATYGDDLKWGCDPASWRTKKLADDKLPKLRDYVTSLDEDDCIEWHLSSSEQREEVAGFSITCMTERGWQEDQISWMAFQLPRSYAFDDRHRKQLESYLHLCIEKLEPFHGHAGLTAVSPEQEIAYEGDVFDVATRYQALYIEGAGDILCATQGPKSINWITIVGDVLTERLGGPQVYADYCRRSGIEPERCGKALVIRAGTTPEIGPVSDPQPEAYVRANTVLRPLRDGSYDSMGGGSINGEVRFNRCTSDLWIRRFDMPEIWPRASFIGLGKEPIGQKPAKKLRLKTGDRCQVYGRYQRSEAGKPDVTLFPGDTAPYWLKLGPHGRYLGREIVTWELVAEL